MKFSKNLKNVTLWGHHYLPYQKLKRKLRNIFSPNISPINNHNSNNTTVVESPTINTGNDNFLVLLENEINKVNSFLLDEKIPMISNRFNDLLSKYKSIDFTSPFAVSLGVSLMSPQRFLGNGNGNSSMNSSNGSTGISNTPLLSPPTLLDQSSSSLGFYSEQSNSSTTIEVDTITAFQIAMEDILKQLAELDQFSKLNIQAIQKLLSSFSKKKIKTTSTSRRKTSIPETLLNQKNNGNSSSSNNSSNISSPFTININNEIKNLIEIFMKDKVYPLELSSCSLIKKLTIEIEIEYQSICQSSNYILNNSHLALLTIKEKELSNQVSLFCQSVVNNNIASVELILNEIIDLMKELKINEDQVMWVKTLHYCIHKSCFLGNLEMVSFLFKRFKSVVDIHYCDEKDKQFIHIASENGHSLVQEFLLENGSNIESIDFLSRTPLHLASKGCHFDAVQLLIDRKAQINSIDREGCTPLFLGCRSNRSNVKVIQLLLNSGSSLKSGPYGRSPVHELCSKGIFENLSIFLDNFRIGVFEPLDSTVNTNSTIGVNINTSVSISNLINSIDSFGKSPIFESAKHGHLECIQLLLKEPSILIEISDEEKRTPIHEVVANGKRIALDLIIYHLSKESNQTKENISRIINLQDEDGWSALHDAAFYNYTECVKVLLERGSNPFLLDKGEWSPIVHSLYRGNIKTSLIIMEFLKSNPELLLAQEALSTPTLKDSKSGIILPQAPKFDLLSPVINSNSTSQSSNNNIVDSPSSVASSSSNSSISSFSALSPTLTQVTSNESPNKTKKIPKYLMSNVTFTITVPLNTIKPGQSIAIVGNRKAIGSWNPSSALMFNCIDQQDQSYTTWVSKVLVPVNIQLEYKYVIFDGQRLDSWETLPENRKFTPQDEQERCDDGIFGQLDQSLMDDANNSSPMNQSTVFMEKGWLVQDIQIRVRFGETLPNDPQRKVIQPVLLYNGKEQVGRVVVSLKDKFGNIIHSNDQTNLPISKDQSVIFQITNQPLSSCQAIHFDIYRRGMSSVIIGKAVILISDIYGPLTPYKKVIPIVNVSTFNTVGELSIFPLVILPFTHPKVSDILSKTYWKSTLLIGHRGGGAENSRSVGKYKRTHIKENTILSFVTAASLGAQYIEFDVQLSRDLVPVIFHDFEIQTKDKIKVPINKLNSDYFKQNNNSSINNNFISNLTNLNNLSISSAINNMKSSNSNLMNTNVVGNNNRISLSQSRVRSKSMEDIIIEDNYKSINGLSTVLTINENETHNNNNQGHNNGNNQGHSHSTELLNDSLTTLEETFKRIPVQCGFNIEIKYPNQEKEQELKLNYLNRNDYVDIILKVVFEHAGDRQIIFSSFDPDICILCSIKQPKYPVFFLNNAGISQHSDPRCNSIYEAIRFAKSAHCLGIVTNSKILCEGPPIIGQIKSNGLMLVSWGSENNDPSFVDLQEALGCDALIVDHVAYVSKHSNSLNNNK